MAPRGVILYKARQAQTISRPTAPATSGRGSCKQIFAKLRFSFTGDFGSGWAYDKMAGWVRHHGGEYEKEVQCGKEALLRQRYTTHLICTIEEYKKKSSQVKKALSLGKYCNIVVGDWLADCLVSNNSKKRRRVEKGYTLNRVLRRVDKTRKAQERYRESFEEGVRAGHELVDNRKFLANYFHTLQM
ncbi:hypothetical protein B0O99DRAFT_705185 [Bisporella sp. PMI_857]|nr:hypothetical protein B0O99DRAFT_705185 [Bisporella sp. PMI_857]